MEGNELLEDLNKQIAEHNAKIGSLNKIKELIKQFPDLTRYRDRWEHIYYGSATVNSIATEYEMEHSCGCCSEAALIIRPYIELNDNQLIYNKNSIKQRIYSKPAEFFIGNKNPFSDLKYKPKEDWKDWMLKESIHPKVIEAVERIFSWRRED
jgi:hypothetical protein